MYVFQRTVLDLLFNSICSCVPIPLKNFCFCLHYLFYFFWGGDFTVVVFLTFWVNMKFSILITRIPDWSPELGEDVIHRILCDMIKQLIFWRLLLNRKLINNLRAEWIPMTRDTGHLFTQSPLPTDTGRMLKKQGHIRNSYSASCYLPG